jgi:hypothetical protein
MNGLLLFVVIVSCLVFFVSLARAIIKLQEKPVGLAARVRSVQGVKTDGKEAALRDEDEMDKSLLTRVLLPLAARCSRFFSSVTPVSMLQRADRCWRSTS